VNRTDQRGLLIALIIFIAYVFLRVGV